MCSKQYQSSTDPEITGLTFGKITKILAAMRGEPQRDKTSSWEPLLADRLVAMWGKGVVEAPSFIWDTENICVMGARLVMRPDDHQPPLSEIHIRTMGDVITSDNIVVYGVARSWSDRGHGWREAAAIARRELQGALFEAMGHAIDEGEEDACPGWWRVQEGCRGEILLGWICPLSEAQSLSGDEPWRRFGGDRILTLDEVEDFDRLPSGIDSFFDPAGEEHVMHWRCVYDADHLE
jgi:hypothetical protein